MDLFDVIGPVMIGPSSSHTAGAARIGKVARMLLGEPVASADIALHGSFAQTGQGHGTDRALVGGLLGMEVDDPGLREAFERAKTAGAVIAFRTVVLRGAHPNTVQLQLTGRSGKTLSLTAASVGGGEIRVRRLEGLDVDFSGRENTLIVHHADHPGLIASVSGLLAAAGVNIATMQVFRKQLGGEAVMVLELDNALDEASMAALRALADVRSAVFLRGRDR